MEEIRKYFESEHILFQKKFRRMINSTNSISEDCLDYTVLHSVDFCFRRAGERKYDVGADGYYRNGTADRG